MRLLGRMPTHFIRGLPVFPKVAASCRKTHSTFFDDEKLFQHTSGRWLYNEKIQMDRRHVRFNATALANLAARAVGARACTSFQKLEEGSSNKVYLLAFDNSEEVIARIPTPVAGPAHLVTASEVATIDFARTVLQIPVPKVLAWSSHAVETDVGAEFIIMEKAPGIELFKIWDTLDAHPRHPISHQLADIEKKFTSLRFSHYGSIFFKKDLEGYPHTNGLSNPEDRPDVNCDQYAIGPLMDWDLWHGERNEMDIDRGPWTDPISFITAFVNCEKEWLARYGKPRKADDPLFRTDEYNDPSAHIALLDSFLSVAPLLIPDDPFIRPTFWHNDLHLSNLFVSPTEPHNILSVLDWQGAGIGPLYAQARFPRAMMYTGTLMDWSKAPPKSPPPLPDNYNSLSREEQRSAVMEQVAAVMQKFHERRVSDNLLHFIALAHPHLTTILEPVHEVSRIWRDGPEKLRYGLSRVQQNWEELMEDGVPCPLHFTAQEIGQIEIAYERRLRYEKLVDDLSRKIQTQGDGWVPDELYEDAKRKNDELRSSWDPEASGGPYPFQDGGVSIMI